MLISGVRTGGCDGTLEEKTAILGNRVASLDVIRVFARIIELGVTVRLEPPLNPFLDAREG